MTKTGRKLIQAAKEGLQFAQGEADEAGFAVHMPAKINVRKIDGIYAASRGTIWESSEPISRRRRINS